MDGQLSDAHRSRQLLDLVDAEWQADSLSDDDLHLDEANEGATQDTAEELDDSAAVLTDSQGASWSLSVGKHSASSLASDSASGLAPLSSTGGFGFGAATSPFMFTNGLGASAASAVESADGLRWTDLAMAGFAAAAQKQPSH